MDFWYISDLYMKTLKKFKSFHNQRILYNIGAIDMLKFMKFYLKHSQQQEMRKNKGKLNFTENHLAN